MGGISGKPGWVFFAIAGEKAYVDGSLVGFDSIKGSRWDGVEVVDAKDGATLNPSFIPLKEGYYKILQKCGSYCWQNGDAIFQFIVQKSSSQAIASDGGSVRIQPDTPVTVSPGQKVIFKGVSVGGTSWSFNKIAGESRYLEFHDLNKYGSKYVDVVIKDMNYENALNPSFVPLKEGDYGVYQDCGESYCWDGKSSVPFKCGWNHCWRGESNVPFEFTVRRRSPDGNPVIIQPDTSVNVSLGQKIILNGALIDADWVFYLKGGREGTFYHFEHMREKSSEWDGVEILNLDTLNPSIVPLVEGSYDIKQFCNKGYCYNGKDRASFKFNVQKGDSQATTSTTSTTTTTTIPANTQPSANGKCYSEAPYYCYKVSYSSGYTIHNGACFINKESANTQGYSTCEYSVKGDTQTIQPVTQPAGGAGDTGTQTAEGCASQKGLKLPTTYPYKGEGTFSAEQLARIDADKSNIIDMGDFVKFCQAYCTENSAGSKFDFSSAAYSGSFNGFNCAGKVDVYDYNQLIYAWGKKYDSQATASTTSTTTITIPAPVAMPTSQQSSSAQCAQQKGLKLPSEYDFKGSGSFSAIGLKKIDANGNKVIDDGDFIAFCNAYCTVNSAFDFSPMGYSGSFNGLNCAGKVDVYDYNQLIYAWGKSY